MRTQRRGVASPSTGSNQGSGGKSFLRRGAAIVAEAEKNQHELERKKSQGGNVLRFYVKGGEECEIIILDKSLDDVVAFYEHNLQDGEGRWGLHVPCIKDFAECPICKSGSTSSYVMMMSALVLKSFTTKSGTVVPHSKMLLPVKTSQFDTFRRLEAAAKKEAGTMRGMYLVMARSKTDSKSPRIGEPTILDNGKMFDLIPEDELLKDFGHDAVLGTDKKTVIRPENFDITPYDYEKLFPQPDVAAIIKEYGDGKPPVGSTEEALREFEEGNDAESETKAEAPAEPASSARSRQRKRPAAQSEASDESDPFES